MFGGAVGVRPKRRHFFISIYGVTSAVDNTILKVTQDTTVYETIQQALAKGCRTEERVEDYVLVEDVQQGWEKKDSDKGNYWRILDMNEKVLQAQNMWKGCGKFLLRKKTNDPSTRAWMTTMVKQQKWRETMDLSSPDWDVNQQMFLVCIHNVSEDQPYSILRAPISATAQDIITQAMMKARKLEDPRVYVLVEEVTSLAILDPKQKQNSARVIRRVLGDDESVYQAQHMWKNNAGKFILGERDKAVTEQEKKKKDRSPLQRLSFKKLSTLGMSKDKKGKKAKDIMRSKSFSPAREKLNVQQRRLVGEITPPVFPERTPAILWDGKKVSTTLSKMDNVLPKKKKVPTATLR